MSSPTAPAATSRPGAQLGLLRVRRGVEFAVELIRLTPEFILTGLLIIHLCAPHGDLLLGVVLGIWLALVPAAGLFDRARYLKVPVYAARFPQSVPETEKILLFVAWHEVAQAAGVHDGAFPLAVKESDDVQGSAPRAGARSSSHGQRYSNCRRRSCTL
ncbi:hypothetical protein [Nocardia sp. NPDC020380]|uniref:hypothetical protein n=1 Tax=Nocardia sp. NPDC020380 TaxID=3364309 RepID=UPI0037A5D208